VGNDRKSWIIISRALEISKYQTGFEIDSKPLSRVNLFITFVTNLSWLGTVELVFMAADLKDFIFVLNNSIVCLITLEQ